MDRRELIGAVAGMLATAHIAEEILPKFYNGDDEGREILAEFNGLLTTIVWNASEELVGEETIMSGQCGNIGKEIILQMLDETKSIITGMFAEDVEA